MSRIDPIHHHASPETDPLRRLLTSPALGLVPVAVVVALFAAKYWGAA